MSDRICAYCRQPARGFAAIDDEPYCHGDDEDPTCYMLAQMPEREWLAHLAGSNE